MTNREWVDSLSDDELIRWIIDEDFQTKDGSPSFQRLSRSFISSYSGLMDWMKQEHEEGLCNIVHRK